MMTTTTTTTCCCRLVAWSLRPNPPRAQKMKEAGIPAGLIAHNAAIGACDKGGEWAWTLQVLAEMRAAGIRPDVISYAGAIR